MKSITSTTATTVDATTTAPPSSISETQLSKRLSKYLLEHQVVDTPQGIRRRHQLIAYLETLLSKWSHSLGSSHSTINHATVSTDCSTASSFNLPRILSFGSTRLGVQKPDADLDLVALCPRHVSRTNFFLSFPTFLVQSNKLQRGNVTSDDPTNTPLPQISDIHPVPTAYTPVLKFRIDNLPVDLLFVQVMIPSHEWDFLVVPSDNNDNETKDMIHKTTEKVAQEQSSELSSSHHNMTGEVIQLHDSILIGLDEASVRSINGVRVAQMILDSISPHQYDFNITLRTIKEWAFIHGLYNNALGFLGGIQWAILVAYICKHNPKAKSVTLLKLFFSIFSKWPWPRPVTLCPINTIPPRDVSPLVVWDPNTNPKDAMHLMPIITPAYPSMNASYNVGMPQMKRLQHELLRADRIIKGMVSGEYSWDHLFMSNDFFRQHVHYLQVDIISSTIDDHRAWFGFCESRLRLLINGLEAPESGVQCFPFAKFFHNDAAEQLKSNVARDGNRKEDTEDIVDFISSFFIALRFSPKIESIDLKPNTLEFTSIVNSWENRKEGMDILINHVLNQDLPSCVHDTESRESSVKSSSSTPPQTKRVKRSS